MPDPKTGSTFTHKNKLSHTRCRIDLVKPFYSPTILPALFPEVKLPGRLKFHKTLKQAASARSHLGQLFQITKLLTLLALFNSIQAELETPASCSVSILHDTPSLDTPIALQGSVAKFEKGVLTSYTSPITP